MVERLLIKENWDIITKKADRYARCVYKISRDLPKDEIYGITSQVRRAALSVPLNIIEGYARRTQKEELNFTSIAYGSLKESQYLLVFIKDEYAIDVEETYLLGDEVAKMLWSKQKTLKERIS